MAGLLQHHSEPCQEPSGRCVPGSISLFFFCTVVRVWLSSAPVRRRTLRLAIKMLRRISGASLPLSLPFFPRCPSGVRHPDIARTVKSVTRMLCVRGEEAAHHVSQTLAASHYLSFSVESFAVRISCDRSAASICFWSCVGSIFVVGTDCCGSADLWFILWWDLGTVGLLALCVGMVGCASRRVVLIFLECDMCTTCGVFACFSDNTLPVSG